MRVVGASWFWLIHKQACDQSRPWCLSQVFWLQYAGGGVLRHVRCGFFTRWAVQTNVHIPLFSYKDVWRHRNTSVCQRLVRLLMLVTGELNCIAALCRLPLLSKLCFEQLLFLCTLLWGKRLDCVWSELCTSGRKQDGSMVFEETARRFCCSPEADLGINRSRSTHEMGCLENFGFGLFCYWLQMKEVQCCLLVVQAS